MIDIDALPIKRFTPSFRIVFEMKVFFAGYTIFLIQDAIIYKILIFFAINKCIMKMKDIFSPL